MLSPGSQGPCFLSVRRHKTPAGVDQSLVSCSLCWCLFALKSGLFFHVSPAVYCSWNQCMNISIFLLSFSSRSRLVTCLEMRLLSSAPAGTQPPLPKFLQTDSPGFKPVSLNPSKDMLLPHLARVGFDGTSWAAPYPPELSASLLRLCNDFILCLSNTCL